MHRYSCRMKKIVTIGGGTGRFGVLLGLKRYPVELSAIVSMFDDGGSTGRLRDELGVLPSGDLRQSLIALGESGTLMRELFSHRYENGGLEGHNFGNIFISTLEKITGSIDKALEVAGTILNIKGRVIPVTLDHAKLVTELNNGIVIEGEDALGEYQLVSKFGIKKIALKPKAAAHPKALAELKKADIITVGPGDLYTSLVPNFLVEGFSDAFVKSKAQKVYIANLMNLHGHTDDFTVADHVHALEKVIGKEGVFDTIVYNTKMPPPALVKKYAEEGEPVIFDEQAFSTPRTFVGADILADDIVKKSKGDALRRVLIRHSPEKLAKVLATL